MFISIPIILNYFFYNLMTNGNGTNIYFNNICKDENKKDCAQSVSSQHILPWCLPTFKTSNCFVSQVSSHQRIFKTGSLSNDVGDGNENGKKAIDLDWQNNNLAHASRFMVHFFAVNARLRFETF